MTDAEWEVALGVLAHGGRTAELWSLVLEAPPKWGARILGLLGDQGWQPPAHADLGPFTELVAQAGACPPRPPLGTLTDGIATLECHEGTRISALAVTPDGSLLASSGGFFDDHVWHGTVRLWSLPEGRPLATLEGADWASPLAVTPDGALLASAGDFGTVRLWSLPEGRPLATLRSGFSSVQALAVTPDGALLASTGYDGTRLWSLPEGRPLATLKGRRNAHLLAVTPDGALLANAGTDGCVRLWSLPDGRRLATLRGHPGSVRALAVTPDGALLASSGFDDTVRLWSLPDGRSLATLEPRAGCGEDSLAIAPRGDLLVSAGSRLRLWSLPDGRLLATLNDPWMSGPGLVAIAPDGSLMASGASSLRGGVVLWSLPDGRPLAARPHPDRIHALVFTPDGSLLASAGEDNSVRLWGSSLDRLSRAPLATIGASDLYWLQQVLASGLADGERAWVELILGLVRFRQRHEPGRVDDAHVAAGEFDIEING